MDQLDKEIIALLKQNSRLTNKEIGEQIHLSGQAVGSRISQLVDKGSIKNFTITVAYKQTQYIRLFMNQPAFAAVERIIAAFNEIEVCDQVSGQACYVLIAHFEPRRLAEFIEAISKWARYSVETVLADRKQP